MSSSSMASAAVRYLKPPSGPSRGGTDIDFHGNFKSASGGKMGPVKESSPTNACWAHALFRRTKVSIRNVAHARARARGGGGENGGKRPGGLWEERGRGGGWERQNLAGGSRGDARASLRPDIEAHFILDGFTILTAPCIKFNASIIMCKAPAVPLEFAQLPVKSQVQLFINGKGIAVAGSAGPITFWYGNCARPRALRGPTDARRCP